MVRSTEGDPELALVSAEECAGNLVEGVVVVQPAPIHGHQALEILRSRGISVVSLEPVEGASVDYVTVDRKNTEAIWLPDTSWNWTSQDRGAARRRELRDCVATV